MLGQRQKLEKVQGQKIAPPRLTMGAAWVMLKYFFGPFLVVLGGLDLIGYLYFRYALDRCYGVLCWFQ